jgi:hypothetical protein
MASETSICNNALRKLGAGRITSLDENSKNARVCKEIYVGQRDAELRTHVWNFAKKKEKLTQGTTPVSGFDYAHELPDDWLRTVGVHGDDAEHSKPRYETIVKTIESNHEELWITFVRQVTDTNTMDVLFRRALAYRIAMTVASALEGTVMSPKELRKGYRIVIRTARSVDAIEDYPEQMPVSDWEAARG